jgi:cation diffusion facilitator family transporter
MASSGHGTRAVVAALLANVGIAVAKFVGFLLTSSASMLAESVHSVADSGNQVLLLLGQKRSRRAPTAEHPFGYGRERYFWAFVVALILFSLGGMFAIYEGVSKIRHPHEIESASIAIGILLVAIALESASLRTAVVEARKAREVGMSWWGFIHRSKQPELPVVLLEDLGALVGLFFALAAVSASVITDDPLWDAIGTISIGALLVVIAIVLAIEMKGLLIGEAASIIDQQRIAAAIEIEPSVARLIHMRTQHIGPDELLVGAKVELVHGMSVDDAAEAVNRIENSVRRAVPTARIMYIEPDMFRTSLPSDDAAPLAAGTVLTDLPAESTAGDAKPE